MTEESYRFIKGIEFICPFCEGRVQAGDFLSQDEETTTAVLHTEPVCMRFRFLEPTQFLTACRQSFQQRP
jgi:hypothetical protein